MGVQSPVTRTHSRTTAFLPLLSHLLIANPWETKVTYAFGFEDGEITTSEQLCSARGTCRFRLKEEISLYVDLNGEYYVVRGSPGLGCCDFPGVERKQSSKKILNTAVLAGKYNKLAHGILPVLGYLTVVVDGPELKE